MRIAVLSDCHGNLQALEAAAAGIRAWSPDRIWFLGDAVAFGPDPAPCVALLRDLEPEIAIEGNTDRYLREGQWRDVLRDDPGSDSSGTIIARALALADAALDDPARAWLGALQRDVGVDVEGLAFHLCHGAPGDDEFRLAPDADFEEVANRVREPGADVVLAGHTHVPWEARFEPTTLINDGSVGYPFDGDPRGSWMALIAAAGELTVEIQRFEFDREETIRRLEPFGAMAEILVRRLRTGRP